MTRGKWVALAVGLAVIAVLVLNGPTLWRAVAYEEERHEDILVGRYVPDAAPGSEEPERPDYMLLIRKRFSWLPGPNVMVRCSWCVESDHLKCSRLFVWIDPSPVITAGEGDAQGLRPRFYRVPAMHTCNCPHPSHAEDSE